MRISDWSSDVCSSNLNKQFTLNNSTQIIPLAFSSVRETDTIVRAHDGQVIVIGGLMSDRSERNNAGLPGLSSVPGVGELFKHPNDKSRKTELVILLRLLDPKSLRLKSNP